MTERLRFQVCEKKKDWKEDMKMKTFKFVIAAACGVLVAGCNTVRGIGKDIQVGGSIITTASETVEREL